MSTDFWSRRRAAVAEEARQEHEAAIALAAQAEPAAVEPPTEEEVLAELGLPDPDDMTEPAQVKTLLNSVAPEALKRRALRKLWRLNPVLANVDGLVDYGGDFTDSANVIENMQTVYTVGKGMLEQFKDLLEDEEDGHEAQLQNDTASEGQPQLEETQSGQTQLATIQSAGEDTNKLADKPLAPHVEKQPEDDKSIAFELTPTAMSDRSLEAEDLPAAPVRARRMQFRFEAM